MDLNPAIPVLLIFINFLLYVGITWATFGVLPSISDSFYFWEKKMPFIGGHIFTIFCWILAFPLVMLAQVMPDDLQWIAFFAGAGFGFVGAACLIKKPDVMAIHGKAAAIGIIFSLALAGFATGIIGWIFVTLGVTAAIFIALNKSIKNKIWWVEIVAFLSFCPPLFLHFLF